MKKLLSTIIAISAYICVCGGGLSLLLALIQTFVARVTTTNPARLFAVAAILILVAVAIALLGLLFGGDEK